MWKLPLIGDLRKPLREEAVPLLNGARQGKAELHICRAIARMYPGRGYFLVILFLY